MTMTERETILKANDYTHNYDLGYDLHIWKLNGKIISIHYNQAKATYDAYAQFVMAK